MLRGAPFGGIIVRFILVENRTVYIHMLVLSYSNNKALHDGRPKFNISGQKMHFIDMKTA